MSGLLTGVYRRSSGFICGAPFWGKRTLAQAESSPTSPPGLVKGTSTIQMLLLLNELRKKLLKPMTQTLRSKFIVECLRKDIAVYPEWPWSRYDKFEEKSVFCLILLRIKWDSNFFSYSQLTGFTYDVCSVDALGAYSHQHQRGIYHSRWVYPWGLTTSRELRPWRRSSPGGVERRIAHLLDSSQQKHIYGEWSVDGRSAKLR